VGKDSNPHEKQYAPIQIKEFANAHDRFLILDENTIYHFGARLKDLVKKWFAFSKFNKEALLILNKFNESTPKTWFGQICVYFLFSNPLIIRI